MKIVKGFHRETDLKAHIFKLKRLENYLRIYIAYIVLYE